MGLIMPGVFDILPDPPQQHDGKDNSPAAQATPLHPVKLQHRQPRKEAANTITQHKMDSAAKTCGINSYQLKVAFTLLSIANHLLWYY